jgi:hypothetical protein
LSQGGVLVIHDQAFLWANLNAGIAGNTPQSVDAPFLVRLRNRDGTGRAFPLTDPAENTLLDIDLNAPSGAGGIGPRGKRIFSRGWSTKKAFE